MLIRNSVVSRNNLPWTRYTLRACLPLATLLTLPAVAAAQFWTPTSTLGAPAARHSHSVVWTGSKMIVWGGGASETLLNSGGVYDPATNAWASTSLVLAPGPRVRHVALWTGTRMIVWGGWDPSGALNTGRMYDPATDTWSAPISTLGAPAGGQAVWTGTRMLVWAGAESASYDPATNTWVPISLAGAPSGGQVAWVGSRMIVWDSDRLTGSLYDPASDSWSRMSARSAPSSRTRPSLAWTGSRLIVWGGWGCCDGLGSGLSASGGAYDPATDTWSAIRPFDPYFGRVDHTAVGAGSSMIMWGGVSGFSLWEAPGGAIYDPPSDTWTSTSHVGEPEGRFWHTAIWTGSRMIVWGGQTKLADLDTGGVYDPAATPAGQTNFYTVAPCRVVDTRDASLGGPDPLLPTTDRRFSFGGACGVPADAKAVSLNVTVVGATGAGNLRLYRTGGMLPSGSAINYSPGQTRANNAVSALGDEATLSLHADGPGTVHVILDVNGYFQ